MKTKTDIQGVVKDQSSGALINTDDKKLNAYKTQKKLFRDVKMLQNEVVELREQLQRLKEMV